MVVQEGWEKGEQKLSKQRERFLVRWRGMHGAGSGCVLLCAGGPSHSSILETGTPCGYSATRVRITEAKKNNERHLTKNERLLIENERELVEDKMGLIESNRN